MHLNRLILPMIMGVTAAATQLSGQVSSTFAPPDNPPFSPSGNWHDASKWAPATIPNGGTFDVTIGAGTVFLNADAEIGSLKLMGPDGSISQGGDDTRKTLTVNRRFTFDGGSISSDVTVNINGGIDFIGADSHSINTSVGGGQYFQPILKVRGDSSWSGARVGGQVVADLVDGRPLFDFLAGTFTITAGQRFNPHLRNAGTVTINPGEGAKTTFDFVTNDGVINVLSGTADLAPFVAGNFPQPTSTGQFAVAGGATLLLSSHTLTSSSSITGMGNVILSGSIPVNLVTLGGDYTIAGTTTINGDVIFPDDAVTGGLIINSPRGELAGKITAHDQAIWQNEELGGTGEIVMRSGIDFTSDSTMSVKDSLSLSVSGASTWSGSGRIELDGTSAYLHQADGTWTINGERNIGGSGTFTNAGTIRQTVDRTFFGSVVTNTGTLVAQAGATLTFNDLKQTAGELRAEGGTLGGSITTTGGRITGNGSMLSPITAAAGVTIAPGANGSAGVGEFSFRELELQSGSVFAIDLAGAGATQHDRIVSDRGSFSSQAGDITLGGALQIRFHSGFQNTITPGDTFTIAEARLAILGAFSNVAPGARLNTADGRGSFIVDYGASSPTGDNRVVLHSFEPSANHPVQAEITSISASGIGVTLDWTPFGDGKNYTVHSSTTAFFWSRAKTITNGATTATLIRNGDSRFYRITSP